MARVCNGDMKEVDTGITSVMAQSNYPTAGCGGGGCSLGYYPSVVTLQLLLQMLINRRELKRIYTGVYWVAVSNWGFS